MRPPKTKRIGIFSICWVNEHVICTNSSPLACCNNEANAFRSNISSVGVISYAIERTLKLGPPFLTPVDEDNDDTPEVDEDENAGDELSCCLILINVGQLEVMIRCERSECIAWMTS